jgi:hypothetical protein
MEDLPTLERCKAERGHFKGRETMVILEMLADAWSVEYKHNLETSLTDSPASQTITAQLEEVVLSGRLSARLRLSLPRFVNDRSRDESRRTPPSHPHILRIASPFRNEMKTSNLSYINFTHSTQCTLLVRPASMPHRHVYRTMSSKPLLALDASLLNNSSYIRLVIIRDIHSPCSVVCYALTNLLY